MALFSGDTAPKIHLKIGQNPYPCMNSENKQTKTNKQTQNMLVKTKFKYIPSDEKETPFDLVHFFGGYGTKNPFEDWTGVAMRESW